ncbi:MAG: SDR family oxidoreductase [Candidatus Neomarinimicrobiota bacterium]
MSKYLVTGGAGFIGSNIVVRLVERGDGVRVLDNFSTGRRGNLEGLENELEVIEGDMRSYHIVREAVDGVDYVLHQGALPSVPRSIRDPITSMEVNVNGTLHILDAAVSAGVKRVIYASSSSIYGNSMSLPKSEDMKPDPKSPYATSKLAGEHYCRVFTEIYGLETVCLRYFNVFGPHQDPTSQYSAVIPKFIRSLQERTQPTIYGDGTQSRDFTYVANIVAANLLACTAPDITGETLNIACGQRHTLLDLVAALNEIMGTDIEPLFAEPRQGDVLHSHASIEKAQAKLGYATDVDFPEGLARTVAYYEEAKH